MEIKTAINALSALSLEIRLETLRALIKAEPQGRTAGELASFLAVPANTLSNNLSILSNAGLIRSVREGREIRYFANMSAVSALMGYLLEDCCGGRAELCRPALDQILNQPETPKMAKPFNVLFLCTGNSARSIIAEAIMNRDGKGQFVAYSAGSKPKGDVHPQSLRLLQQMNHDISQLRSKIWDEFSGDEAPKLDFVFTVCDQAAAEECPFWPGQPVSAHWGLPDPAAVEGSEAEIALAFSDTYRILSQRISIFMSLPLASLDQLTLQNRLDEIGQSGE